MHYLIMISEKPNMIFHLEFLIKSIKFFSKNKNNNFSVIINGNKIAYPKDIKNLKLEKYYIENKYICNNADIFICPYHWAIPVPSRWFITPKEETCIFIDADVIACNNLEILNELNKNLVHGVTVCNKKIMTTKEWQYLGFQDEDLKYYFNFGMIIVPSKYIYNIGNYMFKIIPKLWEKLNSDNKYYCGQIALFHALKNLNIQLNILDNSFNWFDLLPFPENTKIYFLHYIKNKQYINDKNFTDNNENLQNDEEKYIKYIFNIYKKIYHLI